MRLKVGFWTAVWALANAVVTFYRLNYGKIL